MVRAMNISAFLFQLPADYSSLKLTQKHNIQAGEHVDGMCYFRGRLYTTEWRGGPFCRRYRLAVYSVTAKATVTLLDTLDLDSEGIADPKETGEPRIDQRSGRIYIPSESHGVCVVRYGGSELHPFTTLGCVGRIGSLAVASPNTLYVCDWESNIVCLVDVIQDRVTARLQPPRDVKRMKPRHVAFLGDTVLVVYGGSNLVIYWHGVPTSGKLLPRTHDLAWVRGLTTDHHSSFLVTDRDKRSTVYILDISGNVTHTIPIPGYRELQVCTLVGEQLWVACYNGEIIVMSPEHAE